MSNAYRIFGIELSPYSSTSAETNASAGSAGWSAGSGNRVSIVSMIGVESCIAVSSGATTSGISGSFA